MKRGRERQPRRQIAHDVPVVARVVVRREDRRAVLGDVADREPRQEQIEVPGLEDVLRGKDVARVARGLVDVVVDRHHELELRQRPREPLPVGRREHGVARDAHEGPHAALPRRLHLFRHDRRRQRPEELRQPAHAGPPPAPVVADDGPPERRDVGGRRGEHRPALAVEVPGHHVERLYEPRGHGAEGVLAHAHARVRAGTRRRGEVPRQRADRGSVDADGRCHPLRWEARRQRPELRDAGRPLAKVRGEDLVDEDHVQHREEQRRIAAGPDEVVARGPGRALRASRIDEHHPPSAVTDAPHARPHVSQAHLTAVGRRRVRAEDQQVVRAVDVRHRDRQGVAVHVHAGKEARVTVLRVRVEAVLRAQRRGQQLRAERRAVVVDDGVADVEGHGVLAVARADRPVRRMGARSLFGSSSSSRSACAFGQT